MNLKEAAVERRIDDIFIMVAFRIRNSELVWIVFCLVMKTEVSAGFHSFLDLCQTRGVSKEVCGEGGSVPWRCN